MDKAKKICGNSCYLGHLPLQKVTGYLFSSRHYQCYKDIPKPHLKKKNKASTRFTGQIGFHETSSVHRIKSIALEIVVSHFLPVWSAFRFSRICDITEKRKKNCKLKSVEFRLETLPFLKYSFVKLFSLIFYYQIFNSVDYMNMLGINTISR